MATKTKAQARKIRHYRVRNKISGTNDIPRISVFKSNTNFYAQLIDDVKGITLVSSSTRILDLKGNNKKNAAKVGEDFGKKTILAGFKIVVFDRSGYIFHGKVKEFADSARKAGLEF